MPDITSKDNTAIKRLRLLLARKKCRDDLGLFVLEGARLCAEALADSVNLQELIATDSAAQKYPAVPLLAQKAVRTYWISDAVARAIGETETSQGVFCVCQKFPATSFALSPNGKYLLLCAVQDPGNLGARLRTAEALGISGVLADSTCADLYSPKTLRASMGGILRLAVWELPRMEEGLDCFAQAGLPVYAAVLTPDACSPKEVDFAGGCGVLIGNEGNGLPSGLVERCAGNLRIPMSGGAQSLNAAVAAGILLWEITRG